MDAAFRVEVVANVAASLLVVEECEVGVDLTFQVANLYEEDKVSVAYLEFRLQERWTNLDYRSAH